MNFDFSTLTFVLVFFAGLLAGFVDSIAGGGGLIGVPTLLSLGLPPTLALGTNKLQSTFGSFTAMLNYRKAGLIKIRSLILGIVTTAIGASFGAILVQHLSQNFLEKLIPALLILIFLYTLFSPKLGDQDKHSLLKSTLFYILLGLALGFYDGFFGPGTGSFWTFAFVMLLGLNLKKATAHTKVMNFTSNMVSLFTFMIGGSVVMSLGLVMGSGQLIGAYLGSHLVIKKGTRLVRIFFLIVVGITLLKTLQNL